MRPEPFYKQLPQFIISGLTLKLQAWRFSCGAIDPASPVYIFRDLPPLDIAFTVDPLWDKFATLYVVPTVVDGDNYWLTEWSNDPAKAETSNPPTEKWTPEISVVPCLNIIVQKAGDGAALTVTANEFEFPLPVPPPPVPPPPSPEPPPDQRREIQTKIGQIKAWRKTQQPEGWEALDAKKHKKAFPISLGRLKRGENWYVEVPV